MGSISNWDARETEIPLSFLGPGKFEMKIFADGADADKVATHVTVSKRMVNSTEALKIHLAPGGGWAAILTPVAP